MEIDITDPERPDNEDDCAVIDRIADDTSEQLFITQVRSGVDALLRFSRGSAHDAPGLASGFQHNKSKNNMSLGLAYTAGLDGLAGSTETLRALGNELRQALQDAAPHEWDRMRLEGSRVDRIIVEGDVNFHRTPWELLTDTDDSTLRRSAVVRQPKGIRRRREPSPLGATLNILVVTARPYGATDIGHREVVGPLVDQSYWGNHEPPRIDVCRGGDWLAFRHRLRLAAERQDPYHIVHFDMHGDVSSREGVSPRSARIHFEQLPTGEEDPPADLRTVEEVAEVLCDFGIQIAVFNACRSAFGGAHHAAENLAFILAQRGVPAAVGMRQNLSVDGAALFCRELYERLATGARSAHPLTMAVRGARDAMRSAAAVQRLALDESPLPAVFISNTPNISVKAPPDGRSLDYQALARTDRVWSQALARSAPYSVFGRDLDERRIRSLLFDETDRVLGKIRRRGADDVRVVALGGLAGIGRTTLLLDLARHWNRYNYVDSTIWLDGEALVECFATTEAPNDHDRAERAVTTWLDQSIGLSGLVDPEHHDREDPAPPPVTVGQSCRLRIPVQTERARRIGRQLGRPDEFLIAIDNFDAISESTNPGEGYDTGRELVAAVERWLSEAVRSRNWILIDSNSSVDWPSEQLARVERFQVRSLDPASAEQLARRVIEVPPDYEPDMVDLLRCCNRHPEAVIALLEASAGAKNLASTIHQYRSGLGDLFRSRVDQLSALELDERFFGFAPFTDTSILLERQLLIDFLDAVAEGTDQSSPALIDDMIRHGFMAVEHVQPRSGGRGRDPRTLETYRLHPALPYAAAKLLRRGLNGAGDAEDGRTRSSSRLPAGRGSDHSGVDRKAINLIERVHNERSTNWTIETVRPLTPDQLGRTRRLPAGAPGLAYMLATSG